MRSPPSVRIADAGPVPDGACGLSRRVAGTDVLKTTYRVSPDSVSGEVAEQSDGPGVWIVLPTAHYRGA
jgi:hypothetical protein